jgi:hypothetical protein
MPSLFFPPTRTVDKSDGKGDRPSQAKGAILSGQLRDLPLTSTTLLSIFLLSCVIFCKMRRRGVGRPTLATQH